MLQTSTTGDQPTSTASKWMRVAILTIYVSGELPAETNDFVAKNGKVREETNSSALG